MDDNLSFFSKLSLPMFVLFMTMFVAFTHRLLGKRLFYLIEKNNILKHFIAYFNLLFFIMLANEKNLDDSLGSIIVSATIVYALVTMVLTLHPYVTLFIIFMLFIIYILDVIVKIRQLKDEKTAHNLNNTKNMIAFTTFLIIVYGFFEKMYTTYYIHLV